MNALVLAASLAIAPITYGAMPQPKPAKVEGQKVAATCFKTGEQVSGLNKICYYNCLGSTVTINVSSVSLCPLQINR